MSANRRQNSILAWVVVAALLGAAIWALMANVVFVVRDVRVVGAGDLSDSEVRRLAEIRLGTRMGALDEQRIRLNVESDGRLAFVSLEKHMPSVVVLNVRLRTADAIMLQGGNILVLDSDAYVIRITDELPDGMVPYVTGIKVANPAPGRQLSTADGRCGAMKAVLEALKEQGATRYVAELSLAKLDDIRVITRTGMTVLLGDAQNMTAKVAWMAGALADLEARGEITGLLDVSSGTKADYRPPRSDAAEGETAPDAQSAPAS